MSSSNGNEDFVFDSFDLNDEKLVGWDGTGGGPPEIAPGEHMFEFVSAKSVPTKNGDGRNIECEVKVVGGEYDGKAVRQWYHYASDKGLKEGSKKRIAHVFRDVLGIMNAQGGFEGKDIIGKRMYATVAWTTSKKYNAEQGTEKEYTNIDLSCERRVEDEQQAAGAATTNAPPTRAASAPPARPPARPAAPPARPAAAAAPVAGRGR